MTRKGVLFRCCLLTSSFAAMGFGQLAAQLEVVLVSEGQPLPGVEVLLRLDDRVTTRVTDEAGRAVFEAGPGVYELEAGLPGFQTVLLKDIRLSDQRQQLTIVLPRALGEEDEPLVRSPEIIPAPALHVSFHLVAPRSRNQVMAGAVTLFNRGAVPVLVPTQPWSGSEADRSEFLLMNIGVVSPDYRVGHNSWTGCRPSQCRSLGPSESLAFPVVFMEASGNQDQPASFRESGDFLFQVGVSFVPPGSPEKRTEPLKMEYVITIPELP